MKKKYLPAALACLLALVLSLSACSTVVISVPGDPLRVVGAMLGANGGGDGTPQQNADAQQNTPAPATDAPVDVTPVTDAPATDAPADTPATNAPADTPATNPAPSQPAANGKPTTKEEIVNYYVAAYNKIATDAKSITRTYDYTRNYRDYVNVGGNDRLAGLATTLMNQFMKEDFSKVNGTIADLPPKTLSKITMTAADVSTAVCTDKGSAYEIVLKSTGTDSQMETDCQPGTGSAGKIGPLLRTEDVSGAAGSLIKFEGLHAYYPTGQVTATVDKASGHITELKFDCPCILHFDKATAFVVVTVTNTEIGLEFLQNWTLTY